MVHARLHQRKPGKAPAHQMCALGYVKIEHLVYSGERCLALPQLLSNRALDREITRVMSLAPILEASQSA